MAVYDTSLVDASERETDFAKLLDAAVDPAVEMCERMADLRKNTGSTWNRDVFLVNCLEYLQHTLESYAFTAPRVRKLQGAVQEHVDSMTFEHVSGFLRLMEGRTVIEPGAKVVMGREDGRERGRSLTPQHGKLLEQSGLAPVMKAIRARDERPLSQQLPAKELQAALGQFSQFLTSHDPLTSPRLALLANPRLAETIHGAALRHIADAYGEIADRVQDKKEGYEFPETLLRRGKDEVQVALGVTA